MNACGKSLLLAVLLAASASSSAAEPHEEQMVRVQVVNKLLLKELNLTAPITVDTPLSIAAGVCGINVDELAEAARKDPLLGCEAKTTSPQFNYFVLRQAAANGTPIDASGTPTE